MSEQDFYKKIINFFEIDLQVFLDFEKLNSYQENLIKQATEILKLNTVGDLIKYGGNVKKNENQLKTPWEQVDKELEKEEYKDQKSELKDFVKSYLKVIKEKINKTCGAIIPVKEMPFIDVHFNNIPQIEIGEDSTKLHDTIILYTGEIRCILPRAIIHGKIKNVEPLFAPVMENIKWKEDEMLINREISPSTLTNSLDNLLKKIESPEIKNFLVNYQENFQRHGDPYCDYLHDNNDLMGVMNNLTTGLESGRIKSNIVINAIAIPQPSKNTTFIAVINESTENINFENCFEALLKFSALCCEAATHLLGENNQGEPELDVRTEEELVENTKKRQEGSVPLNLEVWTEEELEELAKSRGVDIPEGMEVWDEKSLEELAKKRQMSELNIPEWEPDENLTPCPQCGYALRPEWKKCPICNTPRKSDL
ncbi:MAG: hypothetical protein ACTSXH_00370 [Promethearchaeota archaeon]